MTSWDGDGGEFRPPTTTTTAAGSSRACRRASWPPRRRSGAGRRRLPTARGAFRAEWDQRADDRRGRRRATWRRSTTPPSRRRPPTAVQRGRRRCLRTQSGCGLRPRCQLRRPPPPRPTSSPSPFPDARGLAGSGTRFSPVRCARTHHSRQCDVSTPVRLAYYVMPIILWCVWYNVCIIKTPRSVLSLHYTAQRCSRAATHEMYAQALLRWVLHVISSIRSLHCGIDIALPLYLFYFLFHYYSCCILLPYVVNRDVQQCNENKEKKTRINDNRTVIIIQSQHNINVNVTTICYTATWIGHEIICTVWTSCDDAHVQRWAVWRWKWSCYDRNDSIRRIEEFHTKAVNDRLTGRIIYVGQQPATTEVGGSRKSPFPLSSLCPLLSHLPPILLRISRPFTPYLFFRFSITFSSPFPKSSCGSWNYFSNCTPPITQQRPGITLVAINTHTTAKRDVKETWVAKSPNTVIFFVPASCSICFVC